MIVYRERDVKRSRLEIIRGWEGRLNTEEIGKGRETANTAISSTSPSRAIIRPIYFIKDLPITASPTTFSVPRERDRGIQVNLGAPFIRFIDIGFAQRISRAGICARRATSVGFIASSRVCSGSGGARMRSDRRKRREARRETIRAN